MGATRVGKEEEASEWRRGLKFKLFNCDTFVSCESSSGRFLAPCGRVNPSSVVRQQIFRFSFVWGVTFGSGLFEKSFFCVTVILSFKIVLKIYYFFQKALFKCDPTNVSQLLYLFRFGSFFENKKKVKSWTIVGRARGNVAVCFGFLLLLGQPGRPYWDCDWQTLARHDDTAVSHFCCNLQLIPLIDNRAERERESMS